MSQKNGPNSDTLEFLRIFNETLTESEYKAIIPELVPIFKRNLSLGRVRVFLRDSDQTLQSYLFRLGRFYTLEADHISALQSDDEPIQSNFYKELSDLAYHYQVRRGTPIKKAKEKAHDAAQDTWFKIFTGQAIYPFDVRFAAWSTTILYNQIKKAYARKKDVLDQDTIIRLDVLPVGVYESIDFQTTSQTSHGIQLNVAIWQALSLLTIKQRQACVLFYIHKLPAKEVAKILDCTCEAVNARCYQACQKLKNCLQSSGLDLSDFLSSARP